MKRITSAQNGILRKLAMTNQELGTLLNTLLEAERAGARLLAVYLAQLPRGSALHAALADVQRDEAHNCAVLIGCLGEIGIEASRATGAFLEKGMAIDDWQKRLSFLNRGQDWVARRLAEALPDIADPEVRSVLEDMHASHLANIARCEALPPGVA